MFFWSPEGNTAERTAANFGNNPSKLWNCLFFAFSLLFKCWICCSYQSKNTNWVLLSCFFNPGLPDLEDTNTQRALTLVNSWDKQKRLIKKDFLRAATKRALFKLHTSPTWIAAMACSWAPASATIRILSRSQTNLCIRIPTGHVLILLLLLVDRRRWGVCRLPLHGSYGSGRARLTLLVSVWAVRFSVSLLQQVSILLLQDEKLLPLKHVI